MTSLALAALELVTHGAVVLPLDPMGKRPHSEFLRHGLDEATDDPEVVELWWGMDAQANLGVRTGLRWDVLDVDGDTGRANLECLLGGRSLPPGPCVDTGGGGVHYYFRSPGLGNRAGFLPGLDWRGERGYVVAPPSVHRSRGRYRWRPGHALWDLVAPEVPVWLEELVRPAGFDPRLCGASDERRLNTPRCSGDAVLEEELTKVRTAPPGSRNDQLNRSAFRIGALIRWRSIPDRSGAEQRLLDAGVSSGLSPAECWPTIHSGLEAGLRTGWKH